MRIAVCTLSAVLLSGCSWLGMGGSGSQSASGCLPGYGGQYGGSQYATGWQQAGYGGGAGCGVGGQYAGGNGYGAAGYGHSGGMSAGYGASGYGQGGNMGAGYGGYGQGGGMSAGYGGGYGGGAAGLNGGALGAGMGAGMNGGGAYGIGGAAGYGAGGAYGAGGGPVTLGPGAAYGSAVGSVAGGQYAQYASYGGAGGVAGVQTIQGAPIYVPAPYPQYVGGGYNYGGSYGYGRSRLRVGGSAQPIGLAGFAGTSVDVSGELFGAKPAEPGAGGGTYDLSAFNALDYADAFENTVSYGGALEYDVNRNTTLFAGLGYSESEGASNVIGTVTQGATTEDINAQFTDLKEVTVEGGFRRYVGNNLALRPYVGASAGFVHNNDVDVTQSSETILDGALFTQQYITEGWNPTAAGIIGAEMNVGPNAAIGVETGLRWSDDRKTNIESEDRWSVPVQVRGRIAF